MKNRKIIKLSAGILIMTAIPICSQNNLSRIFLSEEHTEREIPPKKAENNNSNWHLALRVLKKEFIIEKD